MGTTAYLRVGIDGTAAQLGARVVTRSLDEVHSSASHAASTIDTLKTALLSFGGAAVGIYGVATAFQKLRETLMGMLDYMGRIETSTLSIAASFMVGGQYMDTLTGKALSGQRALAAAMGTSKEVIDQLKAANFDTIATLDQLIQAYQVTLPVAMAHGFDKQKVMEFTLAMVQAAGAMGRPFETLAQETYGLLNGTINARQSHIATVLGIRSQDMAKYKTDSTELFSFLMGKLEGFRVAGEASKTTWLGLWSNFKDVAQQALAGAFTPLFDAIKGGLNDIIGQMGTLDSKTHTFTFSPEAKEGIAQIRDAIKETISVVSAIVGFMQKYGDTLGTIAKLYVEYKLVMFAASIAQKALNSELVQTIALQYQIARGNASPFGQVGVNGGMHGDGSTVVNGNVALMNKYKQAYAAEQEAAQARIALEEETATRIAAIKMREAEQELLRATAVKEGMAADRAAIATQIQRLNMAEQNIVLQKSQANAAYMSAQIEKDAAAMQLHLLEQRAERNGVMTAQESSRIANLQLLNAALEENMVVEKATYDAKLLAFNESLTAVTKARSQAVRELATTQQQLVAVDNQLTAAENALHAATEADNVARMRKIELENADTAAILRQIEAQNALTLTSRIAAGAMGVLNGAMAMFGGLPGIAAMAVMALAYKLYTYRDAAREATMATYELHQQMENESATGKLRKEIEEKTKQLNDARRAENPAAAALDDEQRALEEVNKKKKEAIYIEEQMAKISGPFNMYVSDDEKKQYEKYSERLDILRDDIQNTIPLLKQKQDLDKQLQYVQNPAKHDEANGKGYKEVINANRQLRDAERGYLDEKDKVDIQKLRDKNKLMVTESETLYKQLLITDETYLQDKYAAEVAEGNKELAILRKQLERATSDKNAAKAALGTGASQATSKDPQEHQNQVIAANVRLQADYNRQLETEQKTVLAIAAKEGEMAEKKGKYLQSNVLNLREQLQAQSDFTSQLSSSQADNYHAEKETQDYKLAMLERSLTAYKAETEESMMTRAQRVQIANTEKQIALIKASGAKTDYDAVAAVVELNAQIKEELGLHSEALRLRLSLKRVDDDTNKKGKDPVVKELEDRISALKQLKVAYDEQHQNQQILNSIAENDPKLTQQEKEIVAINNKYKMEADWLEYLSTKRDLSDKEQERYWLLEKYRDEELYAAKKAQLETQVAAVGTAMGQIGQVMMKGNHDQFEAGKAMMMGQAVIAAALAIVQCYAQLGPIAGTVAAVGIGVATAAQIATIADTKYEARQMGGEVRSGGSYLVGEAGPEIIRMGSAGGSVIPNHALAQAGDAQLKATKDNTDAIKRLADGFNDIHVAMKDVVLAVTNNGLTTNGIAGMDIKKEQGGVLHAMMGAISDFTVAPFKQIASEYKALSSLMRLDFKGFVDGVKGSIEQTWKILTLGWGGSIFGGKQSITGAGLELGYSNGKLQAQQYTDIKKDGGMFHSDKHNTEYGNLDSHLVSQFDDIAKGIAESINIAGKALGGLSVDLKSLSIAATKLDLRGMTEDQANQAITKWFDDLGNAMAAKLGGPEAQKQIEGARHFGETSYQAVMRLTLSLQAVQEAARTTGGVMLESSVKMASAASDLIDSFGGLDKYTSAINDYNKVVNTDAELKALKVAAAHRQIEAALTGQVRSIPQTVEQYKKLVQSTDPTSPLYAALIKLSGAFSDIKDGITDTVNSIMDLQNDLQVRMLKVQGKDALADIFTLQLKQEQELSEAREAGLDITKLLSVQTLELNKAFADAKKKAADDLKEAQLNFNQAVTEARTAVIEAQATYLNAMIDQQKEISSKWKSVSDSIKSSIDSITKGADSPLSPLARLAQAKMDFNTNKVLALRGDTDAGGKLGQLGSELISASAAAATSRAAYLLEYQRTLNALKQVGGVADNKVTAADKQVTLLQKQLDAIGKGNGDAIVDAKKALDTAKGNLKELTDLKLETKDVKVKDAIAAADALKAAKAHYAATLALREDAKAQWAIHMKAFSQAHTDANRIIAAIGRAGGTSGGMADVPSLAVGTNYLPADMRIDAHKGERVIPAADNYRIEQMLDNSKGGEDRSEAMLAELRELRAEVARLRLEQRNLASSTSKPVVDSVDTLIMRNSSENNAIATRLLRIEQILDKWDTDGQPETRALG